MRSIADKRIKVKGGAERQSSPRLKCGGFLAATQMSTSTDRRRGTVPGWGLAVMGVSGENGEYSVIKRQRVEVTVLEQREGLPWPTYCEWCGKRIQAWQPVWEAENGAVACAECVTEDRTIPQPGGGAA